MKTIKLSTSKEDWLLDSVLAVLIAAVVLFQIDKALGVTWGYADEISYWGTAAMLTGKDWSDFMSYSSYYSFIYGLLLIPIISLPFDSVLLYRLAIILNAFLLVLTYFVSCRCMMKIFYNTDKKIIRITCAAVVLYSSNIFYAQNTNGEILYLLLFWILLSSGLFFLEKKSVSSAVYMTLMALLNFAAHMRSLSLLLATILLILAVGISEKNISLFWRLWARR